LVSINVPTGKARAVVDAMERDMITQLASKSDLDSLRRDLRAEIALMRQELKSDMELLRSSMTIRLGSMLVVGLSLLFAALKLT
jgi:hypothetical protein